MKTLKYYNTIFISLLGLLLTIFSTGFLVLNFKDLTTLGNILCISGIMGGLIIIYIMKIQRVNARQEAENDKYGNKKKDYKYLSAQERKIIDMAITVENEQALSDAEYRTMIKPGIKNPDEVLKNLIGLKDVKQKIKELKAQMEYVNKKDRHTFHMCYLGNPGTGKTTVAGIITGYLYKYKFIKKNEYVCTDASSIMSSSYASRKMKLILQKSHGKVLFIDEAYAFAYNAIGNEILAMLLNEMENSRNDITVIFAGYKKEMKMLFNMNSGLQSRINTYIFFEDYDQNEMDEILHVFAKQKNIKITEEANEEFIKIFIWKKCQPTFANARTVRKIFENALSKHYYNLSAGIIDKSMKDTIMLEDIEDNSQEDEYFTEF